MARPSGSLLDSVEMKPVENQMENSKGRIVPQTTGSGPRWPWLAAAALAVPVFGMVAAFGTVQEHPEPPEARTVVQPLELSLLEQPAAVSQQVYFHEERFQRGDTLAALLERLGMDPDQALRLTRSREAAGAFRALRPGMTVQAALEQDGALQSLWFIAGRDSLITIDPTPDGFSTSEKQANLSRTTEMRSGEIVSSLFAATDAAGVPDNVASQIAEVFAGDVDFHRDLRRGDRFTVVFEMYSHAGRAIKSGRVLAAEFVNDKKSYRTVWFQSPGGIGGYYTPEGKSLRKAFLRSPLEFSRVSSGFGMRHHPILQQWRAHKGVDYAAPIGTRVKATGDGMVDFAGRQNGFGNVVVIRHSGGYSTYYAHLNGFASGVRKGTRIAQGDLVGFVGKTGWATGPHLHYEFHVNNQHRNPLTMVFPASQPVAAAHLPAFQQETRVLAQQLDLLKNSNLALLE